MHEAPAAITLLWQVWSHPVHGKIVAKAAGFEVSRVEGSRSLQLSGMSWARARVRAAARAIAATRRVVVVFVIVEVVGVVLRVGVTFVTVLLVRRRSSLEK